VRRPRYECSSGLIRRVWFAAWLTRWPLPDRRHSRLYVLVPKQSPTHNKCPVREPADAITQGCGVELSVPWQSVGLSEPSPLPTNPRENSFVTFSHANQTPPLMSTYLRDTTLAVSLAKLLKELQLQLDQYREQIEAIPNASPTRKRCSASPGRPRSVSNPGKSTGSASATNATRGCGTQSICGPNAACGSAPGRKFTTGKNAQKVKAMPVPCAVSASACSKSSGKWSKPTRPTMPTSTPVTNSSTVPGFLNS
jgi:hypothetical protein